LAQVHGVRRAACCTSVGSTNVEPVVKKWTSTLEHTMNLERDMNEQNTCTQRNGRQRR